MRVFNRHKIIKNYLFSYWTEALLIIALIAYAKTKSFWFGGL